MSDSDLRLLQSQLDDFTQPPVIIEKASGLYVYTRDGVRLLDLSAGYWLVCLGYGNQEVIQTMAEAAAELSYAHLYRFAHEPAIQLAGRLVNLARPLNFQKVLFGNSGSEAVEIALQLVARYAELNRISNPQIAYLRRGYHGSTFLEQCLTTFRHYPATFTLTQTFHAITSPMNDQMAERSLSELNAVCSQRQVAAFLCEPVQGVGGVVVPPSWFFPAVREICDRHGTLLVFDESTTGIAVTGNWFGYQTLGGEPDIVVLAKKLGGGYFPISAVLVNEKLSTVYENGLEHGHTTSGHPVGCKVALKVLEIIERDNLIAAARIAGRQFHDLLKETMAAVFGEHAFSGCGLMLAVKTPDSTTAKRIQREAIDRGLLFIGEGRFVVLSPALTINEEQIQFAVEQLSAAVAASKATPNETATA